MPQTGDVQVAQRTARDGSVKGDVQAHAASCAGAMELSSVEPSRTKGKGETKGSRSAGTAQIDDLDGRELEGVPQDHGRGDAI